MERLRIVTTGLAVTYPFGGVFWDYMQYALGLLRLGHDVLYLEDTGKWCYDPEVATWVEDGTRNVTPFAHHVAKLDPDLADRWCFRDCTGRVHGKSWNDVVSFCRSADLFLNISATAWMRDELRCPGRTALVDTDPLYTQLGFLGDASEEARRIAESLKQIYDVFFTIGENIGQPTCLAPTGSLNWLPLRQPVVLDCFASSIVPLAVRRRVLTTVASWEPTESGPVIDGVKFHGKSAEFLRFLDLPSHSPVPIEVALSGAAPVEQLRQHGWIVRDGREASADPWTYRDYLAHSTAECSVAKNAYVAAHTGWFSYRTACYLALGVPAVVQDTGFSRTIATEEGLFSFHTLEEAAEAIARIIREPERQSAAAQSVAVDFFDSRKVLPRLIEDAFAKP
jgi:hypothetical protein